MKPFFEYSDTLNNPYEAFLFDAQTSDVFPILSHWHYFMEIIYMLEGNAYIEAGGEDYVLEPGDMIAFFPQEAHAIYSTGMFPLRYYVLKFDPVHLNLLASNLPSVSSLISMVQECKEASPFFSGEKFNKEVVKYYFEKSVQAVQEKRFGYDLELHSYYNLIFTEMLRFWEEEGFHIVQKEQKDSVNEKFASVAEYIYSHYKEELSVEKIAEYFHMSYSYFAARFKEYYGQSCSQFIKKVRIQKAEDLLCFTDYDLSYISQETGFCDCSHFIKNFKMINGITPKQYRKQGKNNEKRSG